MGLIVAKSTVSCEGVKYSLKRMNSVESEQGFTSASTEAGTAPRLSRNVDAERVGLNRALLLNSQADCRLARTPEPATKEQSP